MEVKFKMKYLALACGIAFGFASCTNDDESGTKPGGPIVDEGTPTTLSIAISQPRSTYNPTKDPNATLDEAKLEKVDVFIYNDANNLVKHERMSKTQFDFDNLNSDQDKDLYAGNVTITTTTGTKHIYVGVNLPDAIVNKITTTGTLEGISTVNNITVADLTDVTDGFAMFSTTKVTENLLAEPAVNQVSVQVSRLVAKFSVHAGSNLNIDKDTIAGGLISDLRFAVGNSNKKIYPFQQTNGTLVIDPNYQGFNSSYNSSDFESFVGATDYIAINPASVPVIDNLRAKYAPENTSADFYKGETTYISVRGTFVPNLIYDADGTVKGNNVGNNADTFWAVRLSDGTVRYFDSEMDAKTFQTNSNDADSELLEYEDGYVYYTMFINPSAKFNILRNSYYKASITRIYGLGTPDPEPTDPDEKVDETAIIDLQLEIKAWELQEEEYELSM